MEVSALSQRDACVQRVTRWLSSSSPPLVRIVSPHDIDHSRNEGRAVTNRDALVPPGRVGCDAEPHLPDRDVPVAGSMNCRRYRYALSAATCGIWRE